jgi:Lar family restriction alleviation protein
MSALKLRECPFCGGEPSYYASGEAVFQANWIGHVCHCKNCQARVSTSASMEAAIAMWNRRVADRRERMQEAQ